MTLHRFFILFCLITFAALPAVHAEDQAAPLKLGSSAPDFHLNDVTSQKEVSLTDVANNKALVVMFICRHCPYVQHVKKAIAQLSADYREKSVGIVAISSNDATAYPDDAPPSLAEMAAEEGYTFPFLYDETQETAKAYGAKATPDVFIFDAGRKLVYRGQFDSTRPKGNKPATGEDVRNALDAVLKDEAVSSDQKPAVGCSIKWKKR